VRVNIVSAVLVGGDLMAQARLQRAADDGGVALRRVRPEGLVDALRAAPADLLVLDLDAGRQPLLDEVTRARAAGVVPARVVGYFSHVDDELGRAARAAGCAAMPRGRFWRALDDVLGGRTPEG
jgi:hypothetical protein